METRDILIIDDDKDLTRSMQAILEQQNYQVDIANDKEAGMAKLYARKPDLLILDVMMNSDLEGHKLAHTIKSDPKNKDLPILIITGMMDTMGVNIRDAFEDIDDLPHVLMLDKPFETEELLSTVEKMIAGNMEP
jgi:DNA-binding response OmpR family regulator